MCLSRTLSLNNDHAQADGIDQKRAGELSLGLTPTSVVPLVHPCACGYVYVYCVCALRVSRACVCVCGISMYYNRINKGYRRRARREGEERQAPPASPLTSARRRRRGDDDGAAVGLAGLQD
jgi:hypothetical protein